MYKVFIIFFPYLMIFAQPFQVSEIPTQDYTIDKFTSTIYYMDMFTGYIYSKDLTTGQNNLSKFPSLPIFANKSHNAAYVYQKKVYLYDFNLDTAYVLANRDTENVLQKQSMFYNNLYKFSPNDEKILINDNPKSEYYSFQDSALHSIGVDIYDTYNYNEWTSDTTLIYRKYGGFISEINLNNNMEDTLLFINQQYANITSFSYNFSSHELAYSLYEDIPKIYLFNTETREQKIVFDPSTDDSSHLLLEWNGRQLIQFRWSIDQKQLGFFSDYIESQVKIYTYHKDSLRVYKHTDNNDDYGTKYDLNWLNNDTIIYLNASYYAVFCLNVKPKVVGIKEPESFLPGKLNISAYPNPFNSSVKIELSGYSETTEIFIYNINGEQVKSFNNLNLSSGKIFFIWNGKDDNGKPVSSGVYLVTARNKNGYAAQKIINLK